MAEPDWFAALGTPKDSPIVLNLLREASGAASDVASRAAFDMASDVASALENQNGKLESQPKEHSIPSNLESQAKDHTVPSKSESQQKDHSIPSADPQPSDSKAYPALGSRPACEYVNYRALGVSLCFEEGAAAAVHLYNGTDGYSVYKGPMPLQLSWTLPAKDVVERLGEPDVKAGGGSSGPLLIVYSKLGIQIQLKTKSWEERDALIANLTVFKP